MEKLARALSVIQKGMLRNNPGFVKDSVNEAAEVLGGMLNTHRCLLESGVELQKRLETHPASKKMAACHRRMHRWPRARPRLKMGTDKSSPKRKKDGQS